MTPLVFVLLVLGAGLSLLWLYVAAFTSWQVARSEYSSPRQKRFQYCLIWLLPLVGAAVVLHILSPEMQRRRPGWIP